MLENYLRCYCSLRQDDWDKYLPAAEFAYNSAKSEQLQMTPFGLYLGNSPREPLDMLLPTECTVESVAQYNGRINAAL